MAPSSGSGAGAAGAAGARARRGRRSGKASVLECLEGHWTSLLWCNIYSLVNHFNLSVFQYQDLLRGHVWLQTAFFFWGGLMDLWHHGLVNHVGWLYPLVISNELLGKWHPLQGCFLLSDGAYRSLTCFPPKWCDAYLWPYFYLDNSLPLSRRHGSNSSQRDTGAEQTQTFVGVGTTKQKIHCGKLLPPQ